VRIALRHKIGGMIGFRKLVAVQRGRIFVLESVQE